MKFTEDELKTILHALHFVASELDIGDDSVDKERALITKISPIVKDKND